MKRTALAERVKKTRWFHFAPRLLAAYLVCGCLSVSGKLDGTRLQAQTLTTLYSFNGTQDGYMPQSPLVLSGNMIYGSARFGGVNKVGTLFKINSDGSQYKIIYNFTDSDADGNAADPYGFLVLSEGFIYGTASGIPSGTVFKINSEGAGQSILHIFSGGVDGDEPFSGVILSSNTLYGITWNGANVFKVNTDGTAFQILHCLSCETNRGAADTTTYAGLALAGNSLYGVAFTGGAHDLGTIFKVNTDGTAFKILHDFEGGTDGANPWAGLLIYNDKLYGTTMNGGGDNTVGTVFSLNTDGTGYTNLHRFTGVAGAAPQSVLVCANNILYGTTTQGGGVGKAGTVFALNTDGTGYTNIYIFRGGDDGGVPATGLTLSGNSLYGTTTMGGSYSNGTIFRLTLPLAASAVILQSASNMLVSWASSSGSLLVETSTNLIDWTTMSNTPAVVNDQYTLTNDIIGRQRFFRLKHP